jgi:hypothetical protein
MKLALCTAVLSICGLGIQAVRADYDFIGGNSANNANGTETNFFASDGWVNTGASPAYAVGGPPPSGTDPAGGTTSATINFNTGVTDTGAIFDPVNQNPSATLFATNGKVYIDSNNSGPGSTSGTTYSQTYPNNPYTTVQPNYLEIDSGEFHINGTGSASILIVGRSGPGTLIINGGNLTDDNVIQVGGDSSNVAQTGTITYESGVLSSGFGSSPGSSPGIRLGNGLGCTGNFVDYNDGPGNITVSGFYVSYEAGGTGSTGNVAFHYDNGGVMPIQVHNSTANAQLSIRNSATQSSRLSLDLDSSPTMTLVGGVEVPQNLGLFSDDEITGISGDSKDFFDPTGTTDLAEGTAITERAPNGYTDTWDISYQGKINFSDTATSSISSITGPNNLLGDSTTGGTDVVLMGVSAIAPVVGDANGDGIVNTLDESILEQNLGKSVTGGYAAADFNDDGIVNADDVAIFQYGVALYDSSHPTSAPEPAALAVLAAFPLLAARRRR